MFTKNQFAAAIFLIVVAFAAVAPTYAGSPSSPGVGPLNVSITGGNAGGDLGGTYPNPTVLQFNGTPFGTMSTQAASAIDVTGGTVDGTVLGGTTPASLGRGPMPFRACIERHDSTPARKRNRSLKCSDPTARPMQWPLTASAAAEAAFAQTRPIPLS
jgi:hypothetical protein